MPIEVSGPGIATALSFGRIDAVVALRTDGVPFAALARVRRERAMEVAAVEGVPATPLGVAMAHAGVDQEGDRSGRFAADVIEAMEILAGAEAPLSPGALRAAWDASERNNTSRPGMVDTDCDLVSAAFSRPFRDVGELADVLVDVEGASRRRRRLAFLALPHVLRRMYGLGFAPQPVLKTLDAEGEGSAAMDPVAILEARIARGIAEFDAAYGLLSGLKARADALMQGQREDARTTDAFAVALALPVVTPAIVARRLGVTQRGGSGLIAKLEGLNLLGRLPPSRLARQIAVCREALDPVTVAA